MDELLYWAWSIGLKLEDVMAMTQWEIDNLYRGLNG